MRENGSVVAKTTMTIWITMIIGLVFLGLAISIEGFVLIPRELPSTNHRFRQTLTATETGAAASSSSGSQQASSCFARDLVQSLVQQELCYTTKSGAQAFAAACASNVVYEDRFEKEPIIGKNAVLVHMLKKVEQRSKAIGVGFRLDGISDGNFATGFAWTWTCNDGALEGLRGTTFVEVNSEGQIQYVCEIPEPLHKPGTKTFDFLRAVTPWAEPRKPVNCDPKRPYAASDIAKYLYIDFQHDRKLGFIEMMKFFAKDILYRDFNFKDVLVGPAEVRDFVQDFDFSFDGIDYRPLRFDDGVDSTCFVWELVPEGVPGIIRWMVKKRKGISYYALDPESRRIIYVREVLDSANKPPFLAKLARQLRPGLGIFQGVPTWKRPGGM